VANVFAVFTSDPNLIRCELHRLRDSIALAGKVPANAVGMGSYAQDEVLLQRHSSDVPAAQLADAWTGPESEAFLYHANRLPVGYSLEENTQPFRYRRWLFAHCGAVSGFERVRGKLLSTLPDFLQRQVKGDSDSEPCFALFLKNLRDTGRTEDRKLDAAIGAQLLGKTVRQIEQLASEAGSVGKSTLNFVATNGRMLLATRWGEEPLFYALLEGADRCERCGIDATTSDTQPLLREHRRRKTIALSSDGAGKSGWIELPSGTALAVDFKLNVQTLPI
jgi:predicted glutamine amidotransferase